jgi:hypothetical protein
MSQNDFNLANQSFPDMRSDMNSAFQALASNSSGATAPSTTYAYQWWYDTANDILKMRNGDNDAWINIASFDQATDTWSPYVGATALTATGAELNQLDGNVFTAGASIAGDFVPDADSTRDLGSSTKAWAEAHVDKVLTDTFEDRSASKSVDAVYVTDGLPKMMGSLTYSSGTPSVVTGSLNLSSLTDNGVGDATFNFTNSMSILSLAGMSRAAGGGADAAQFVSLTNGQTFSTSAVSSRRFQTTQPGGTPSFTDSDFAALAWGDLA